MPTTESGLNQDVMDQSNPCCVLSGNPGHPIPVVPVARESNCSARSSSWVVPSRPPVSLRTDLLLPRDLSSPARHMSKQCTEDGPSNDPSMRPCSRLGVQPNNFQPPFQWQLHVNSRIGPRQAPSVEMSPSPARADHYSFSIYLEPFLSAPTTRSCALSVSCLTTHLSIALPFGASLEPLAPPDLTRALTPDHGF
jgi:hypothetical protein